MFPELKMTSTQAAGVVYSVKHMDRGRRRLALNSLAGVFFALLALVVAFKVEAVRWETFS
jgi:hypothetical protein